MARLSTRWLIPTSVVLIITAVLFSEPSADEPRAATSAFRTEIEVDAPGQVSSFELHSRQKFVSQRLAYKNVLIEDLVYDRIAFSEVVTEFLRMNLEAENSIDTIRTCVRGASDEEKSARNLFLFIRSANIPKETLTPAIERLRAEFLCQYGEMPD